MSRTPEIPKEIRKRHQDVNVVIILQIDYQFLSTEQGLEIIFLQMIMEQTNINNTKNNGYI